MANTVIQLKYSTVTAAPSTLNIAEPAYSYSSNTFFIGSPDGTGTIAIGGKFYLDQQQDIYNTANAAFDAANNATDTYVRNHANAAFDAANTNATAITVIQGVNATQNTNITNAQNTGDAAFLVANNNAGINATQNTNITTANNTGTAAFHHANAAFDTANSKFNSSGGTINGDTTISGNLTVVGTTVYANTTTALIADNIFTVNAAIGQASAPASDAGMEVDRGSSANVYVLWNETDDKWTVTNDGTNYFAIGADSGERYANGAFAAANSAASSATAAQNSADAAFLVANNNTGINATQNTNITTAQNTGVAAFLAANNAQTHANYAFNHANAAFGIANTDVTNISISAGDFGGASIVPTFHVSANGRIDSVGNVAIALAASQITSGTLGVARGGTGAGTFTTNGVLLGQGTSNFTTASSSTEGHVLTINDSGVPTFAYLSGGTF